MQMNTQTITREQVIALAKMMPINKLVNWYEYGLFIQSRLVVRPAPEAVLTDEAELSAEFAAWEAASDEDWLKVEQQMIEAV